MQSLTPHSELPTNPAASLLRPKQGLKALALLILFLGIGLRSVNLGVRPLHHDESIHATFSAQWAESPDRSFYKYDPTYHGPFLYCITRWIFPLVGIGTAEARLFPLLFGLLSLFSSLLFCRWIGVAGAAVTFSLLALSPLMVYYSRFLAHDMPSLFFASLMAYGVLRFYDGVANKNFREVRNAFLLTAVALGVLFSVKTVAVLYAFIFLTFFGFELALRKWSQQTAFWPIEWKAFSLWAMPAILGILSFSVAYGIFQTSFFNNPAAFFDGILGKNLSYWWNQHKIERLVGPTTFHLRSLLLHEFPACLILSIALFRITLRWRHGKWALAALFVLFLATVPFSWSLERDLPGFLLSLFKAAKMKSSPAIFLYSMCFVFGILGSYQLWKEKRLPTAFLNYWTFASLAIYSYAGEKAPWLTLHVAFPAVLLCGGLLSQRFTEMAAAFRLSWRLPLARRVVAASFLLLLLYQTRLAYFVSHVTAGKPTDLLSQVHNSEDVNRVLNWMQREAFESGEKNEGLTIALAGNVTWAFYFKFIEFGFKKFVLDAKQVTGNERFIVSDEENSKALSAKLEPLGYQKIQYTHSGWWVPEHSKVGWGDWVEYALFRKPTGAVGTTKMFVFHKPAVHPTLAPVPASSPGVTTITGPLRDTAAKTVLPTK